ncbi:MAG: hypothetical protein FWC15_01155 [Fibromonadales bacterium]|nr:hypothetical protein [Fibromonadales bacterium]
MKNPILTATLFAIFLVSTANAQQKGWMSRYWDGCKPSCSWSGKQYANNVGRCKECDKNNNLMPTNDQNRSSCDGGNSYTCWDMVPWKENDNLAYAFAATPSDQCGQCFELEFDGTFQHGNAQATHAAIKGKKLIVMGSNMGGDVHAGQFDVLVPGGGVGQFDSFSGQIGVNNSVLGSQYGGILAACGNPGTVSQAQSCIRDGCTKAFGKSGQEWLKAGCEFYADWFMGANNPNMTYKTVTCPQALVDRYQKAATGGPGGTTPPPVTTNYTLTVNTTTGGTVSPSGNQTVASGAATTITATANSGYRFINWTSVSGSPTFANASSTPTTVTITANATIRANFAQTFTLNVNAGTGGTVTPTAQQTVNANSPVSISATANSGYKFVNWTVLSGTATFADANSASTTVTLTANSTVRANFEQTVTLTINRSPTAGGNVTGAGNYTTGTAIPITATAASGYAFSGWTVSTGTATFANASNASTTVTLSSNATIVANFTQTYTLTVNRNLTAGGTTTPASSQANVAAGTAVNISTTVNTGYRFVNWTVTSGTATFANANNAATTVTLSSNATIRANYAQTYTLTVNAGANGTVSPSGAQTVDAGAATSITATANSNYRFVNWTVTGSTATITNASSASTTVTLTGNATVTANFELIPVAPTTYTLTINRNPASIGTVTGAGTHNANTAVPITATVPSGYVFKDWTVSTGTATFANANSASTTVTLSSNATIVANYVQTYALTINRSPTAGGTVTGAGNYTAGTPVNISATAATGYVFSGWTVTGSAATIANASNASTTVTLTGAATITANFTQLYTLTVERSPTAGGTTTPASSQANIVAGTAVDISTTVNAAYKFVNWTVTSGTATFANANSASTTVTLSSNATIRANYVQTLTLTVNAGANGTVSPSGAQTVDAGAATSITATASTGYRFVNWTVPTGTATFANASSATTTVSITANATIRANFEVIPVTPTTYVLTINRNPASIGTVIGAGTHNANTPVSITATVPSGYAFKDWTVTTGTASFANASSANTTVTLSSNATIVANYVQTYTLTINRTPTAGGTTTPASSQANIAAGTPVNISATAANGYVFNGWTTGTGATIANPSNASTTVTLTGNATITANFTQSTVTPTTYTLTINAGTGGTVNPSGQQTTAANTPFSITAAANSGYTFNNWTVVSGTATFAAANNANTTVTLTGNATIRANFTQNVVVDDGSFLEFVVNIDPPGSGEVNITPNKPLFLQGEVIQLVAVAKPGYVFDKWEGDDLQGPNPQATTNVWWHRAIFAHFKAVSGGDPTEPVDPSEPGDITKRTDTTKIEAEKFDPDRKVGNFTANTSSNDPSLTTIGYIENGHSATYEVEMKNAGAYTMQFRVANGMNGTNSRFKVLVNGVDVGTVTVGNTGGWSSSNYEIVTLNSDVQILNGTNTITLNFESAINVDYILLLGEPLNSTPINATVSVQTGVKIWQSASGMVNLDLGYTPTYPVALKIYDLKGKLIATEMVNTRSANIKVNVSNGVYLFKVGNSSAVRVLK